MSIASLHTSNGDVNAASLDELNQILSDKYDEKGIMVKSLCRRISCSGAAGVGWFTPDALLQRFNDHMSRLFEDKGITSNDYKNSFRMYRDMCLVVVPQVPKTVSASMTLTLVDSGMPLDAIASDQTVTIDSSDGPVIVLFHPIHSIPNIDRTNFGGNQAHRRLGLQYLVECDGMDMSPSNDVTLFTVSATWKREFSLKPSYYYEQSPTVIPIEVGFREHAALRTPKLLKQYVNAGLDVKHHLTTEHHVKGNLKLTTGKSKPVNANTIMQPPVRDRPPLMAPVNVNDISDTASVDSDTSATGGRRRARSVGARNRARRSRSETPVPPAPPPPPYVTEQPLEYN